MTTQEILQRAKAATVSLCTLTTAQKNDALLAMADALITHTDDILTANALDVAAAADSISAVMIDRLTLTAARIEGMAQGIREVAELPDPVGDVLQETTHKNGMTIRKVSVPLGVVGIIYESRPNVTSDAAALTLKAGNVCVLRGGKEAYRTAAAIVAALREALTACGITPDMINLIEDTTRASAQEMMTAEGLIDMLIPRGGAGLIRACVQNATVPCIQTGTGICHVYVDAAADIDRALAIIDNAKMSRPSVCNAAEVCLVHSAVAAEFLPRLRARLTDSTREHIAELRLDTRAAAIIDGTAAGEDDFDTEFLDYVLAVRVVDSVEDAIAHIAAHSTHHSESIITEDERAASRFTAAVDSAAVYVNVSTRFTDGGEFGLGCEMGISTQKLHARGPMGLREMTAYKYIITGDGQTRG